MGKSSLLSTLTETESEAAAYEFTTLTCIPGNIIYNDTKIQLLDLPGAFAFFSLWSVRSLAAAGHGPARIGRSTQHALHLTSNDKPNTTPRQTGIIEGAAHGKGRGREVIAVARSADLVLMVLDGGKEQVNNHRTILERCVRVLVGRWLGVLLWGCCFFWVGAVCPFLHVARIVAWRRPTDRTPQTRIPPQQHAGSWRRWASG